MISTLNIYFPGKLVFAKNCLSDLPEEVAQLKPHQVLIVTIQPLLPRLQNLIAQLEDKGIAVATDTSILQEPSFSDFENLMAKVKPLKPDVIIGIGGG